MFRTIFGAFLAMLFASAALAQGSYRVQPGDTLVVEVLEDATLNRQTLVLPDGNISFPLAGTVSAAGRSLDQVRADLTNRLAPNFAAQPTVFVSVANIAPSLPSTAAASTMTVYLIGQVNQPGRFEVDPGTTILQFLAESGGFTPFAAKKRVQIRRADRTTGVEQVYGLNYDALERGQNVQGAAAGLRDGDVIVVPERRLFE
ncbi:MAG: polysaccharide biosynthesis/export family protein [Pseudomonadota bacterium]